MYVKTYLWSTKIFCKCQIILEDIEMWEKTMTKARQKYFNRKQRKEKKGQSIN